MDSAYRFILLGFIIALNGFFAGSEAALVSVRRSRLEQLAEEGNTGAQAALSLLRNPERLLSVVQVGVTLASLGLGWAGEETLFQLFTGLFGAFMTPVTEAAIRGLSFVLSFLVMTYMHVVIGEVLPKNLALQSSERLAVLVAPALLVFYRISGPFVSVIERSASALSRAIGLRGGLEGGGHSTEELRFIITTSRMHGHLDTFEEAAIQRVLDLSEYTAREIMVPRNQVVSLSLHASVDDVLKTAVEHQFSRYPVYDKTPENIVGLVHTRDLLRVWLERRRERLRGRLPRPLRLEAILRRPLIVPETKPLNQIIDEFRRSHSHLAIVVDEFGTISGIITLEDVLEEIFGEIEDEHDLRRPAPAPPGDAIELEGTANVRDLETQYGLELPADAGFETLAGFVLYKLGYIPDPGESIIHDGRRFSVLEMDGNRIARVRIDKIEQG